ncbi:Uncharacterized conserved protein [Fulvimarina manganoxydans]|uniref:Uncharacterized conserved protein n=1 Tax=Fulvimarina manganoxydans TaxID=937218 RepID=A0A1W2EM07_9HYPH|nr:DUF1254 domain-containing protein [Fulvimarina manganoxydans]SMD10747.1 Uncharacterized conserved protein [Fulvimarina manganoxydans]
MRAFITRRAALHKLSVLTIVTLGACGNRIDPNSTDEQLTGVLDETVADAFLYAFGPYEFARSMQALSGQISVGDTLVSKSALADAARRAGGAKVLINRHIHVRDLADERIRSVTAPNNDTLYTSAVLELSRTPVRVRLPDSGGRYLSVALMDMFTDQRMIAHAENGGTYLIVGPDSPVRDGPSIIRMPSNDAWLLARVFVAGADDLTAARKVQTGISVEPVDGDVEPRLFTTLAPPEMDPRSFLALTNEVLGRSPRHPQVARSREFTDKGIVPGRLEAWSSLSIRARAAWRAWLPRALPVLRKGLSKTQDKPGWNAPPKILGDYGENDLVRAAIALIGFGALRTRDARYFRTETDASGKALTGSATYRMVIPPEGVPVDAFWSLSVYEPDADGRLFFFKVPIDRHSINSGSSDLRRRSDGSIVLQLSRTRPSRSDVVWVPTPEGKFEAIFRTYEPREPVIDDRWTVPPLRQVVEGEMQ